MKKYFIPTLMVSYLVYLGFIPVNTAHSIIFLALAGLFAYHEFLTRPEKYNYKEMLEQLQNQVEAKLAKQKEEADAKLASVEAEVTKMSLSILRPSASSAAKRTDDKKIIF